MHGTDLHVDSLLLASKKNQHEGQYHANLDARDMLLLVGGFSQECMVLTFMLILLDAQYLL